jgi:hypothetical protein
VSGTTTERVLDNRALNRALLARQHLLERTTRPLLDVVEHLVGLQAQNPTSPYLALWSRCADFDSAALGAALVARQVVRLGCLRSTIHLVTARDALAIRPVTQHVMTRNYVGQGQLKGALAGIAVQDLAARARALLADGPLTNNALGNALVDTWPGREVSFIGNAARALVPLVQIPPRGVWGASGHATWELADRWLDAAMPAATTAMVDALVLRYLRAFGPATAADVQTWSGLAGVAEVFSRQKACLVTYRNERGQILWDVPDGALPDPKTPAPPRLLPDYDNLTLSHADRTRIVSAPLRARLVKPNAVVPGAVLVDGFVCGVWAFERPTKKSPGQLVITLMEPIASRSRAPLLAEGKRFGTFLGDGRACEASIVEAL